MIILGDEHDDGLRDALRAGLIRNSAVKVDKSWEVSGSQEIEAEASVGLSISGR